jgi:hypothetical protein
MLRYPQALKKMSASQLSPCRCDAQYVNIACSCLPGRVAEIKDQLTPVEKRGWEVLGYLKTPTEPSAATKPQSPYEYKHQVDSCACGTCYKARVDSGTQHLYEKKCKDAADAVLAKLKPAVCRACKASASGSCVECYANRYSYDASGRMKMPEEIKMLRQAYYMEEQWYMNSRRQKEKEQEATAAAAATTSSSFAANLSKATTAISQAATGGGGEDFAKNLFAAMGTPHDSKCPHGLPFYACMPCSH